MPDDLVKMKIFDSAFIKEAARTDMQLPKTVVGVVKDAANGKEPEICIQCEHPNKHKQTILKENLKNSDCRSFPRVPNMSSI